jgi:hypothetical protein
MCDTMEQSVSDRYMARTYTGAPSPFPSQRDLDIVVMYTADCMTQREIGEAVGLSQNHVCRILQFWVPDDARGKRLRWGAPDEAKPEQGDTP